MALSAPPNGPGNNVATIFIGPNYAQRRFVSPTTLVGGPATFAIEVVDNLSATVDPSADADYTVGYQPGSLWLNQSSRIVWICLDNAPGAARWTEAAGGGGGGNVTSSGLPTAGQIAQWVSATAIQGVDFAAAMETWLNGLPTTDPGDGTAWLNGGFVFKGSL